MPENTARLYGALADRYKIEKRLGEGGMATVYLAEDLKHKRKVAVKVLRPELAAVLGAERFVQEIQTTASLQHPHILPLFDSGTAGETDGGTPFLFYVMPYIEGETLREKLDRETQLSIDEAVKITTEVADALDYAHRNGVIHRDIKPENILLHDGRPMVADFGIALAVSAAAGGRMTETGLSLGTPHYMSPEQATAEKDITARSDVYSLGSVLYEMLTSEPPHTGGSAQHIIMKIVTEPAEPVTKIRKSVPPNVTAAVAKSLEKLAADRFESAAKFAEALTNPMFATTQRAGVPLTSASTLSSWQHRLAIPMTALAAVMTVLFLWALDRSNSEPSPVGRYRIALSGDQALRQGFGSRLAISRDGARIVYQGAGGQLWLREWERLQATPLRDTDGARAPIFAPTGERVAFRSANDALMIMTLDGAPPVLVADSGLLATAGWWGPDGYLYLNSPGGLVRVPEGGGAPLEPVTTLVEGESRHTSPVGLPNGKGLLFVVSYGGDRPPEVAVVDFKTGVHRTLTLGMHVRYAATGHLIYATVDGTLMAAQFDQDALAITGPPTALTEVLGLGQYGITIDLDLSDDGTLVYVTDNDETGDSAQFVWVSRDGTAEPVIPGWRGHFQTVALSPDGSRLALSMVTQGTEHIYIRGLAGGVLSTLTFSGTRNWRPEWTFDGRGITFVSDRAGKLNLYVKPADGSGAATPLLDRELGVEEAEWSRDGTWLVFREGGGLSAHQRDILAIRPGVDTVPIGLATTQSEEKVPALSPDGRWLAYESSESGILDVWVRPFPITGDSKWKVSASGGLAPLWAHNGRELFYRNHNDEMVVATVQTSPTFAVVSEVVLFSTSDYRREPNHRAYDVAADDQRFLMIRLSGTEYVGDLILVKNFFEELKAKVGN